MNTHWTFKHKIWIREYSVHTNGIQVEELVLETTRADKNFSLFSAFMPFLGTRR